MPRRSRKKPEHKYRSNSEYNTATFLANCKIDFEYESMHVAYEWREDKKYIPDFILPNGIILEVKGRFMLEDRKKHLFIRDQYPHLDIRFVFDNPYRKLYKGGRMTYADWCDKYHFDYCKGGEGIPKEWLKKNARRRDCAA
jgi:hypothetical protein